MGSIRFVPDGRTVDTDGSETILQAAVRAGVAYAHACGGRGHCSTCRVAILDGLQNCSARTPAEQAIADQLHFEPAIRLACQTTVTGDVTARRLVMDEEDVELTSLFIQDADATAAGEQKFALILFADIRGFTTFAEHLLPYDVIHVLNRYFHEVGQVINRHGGYIHNYMGDGLMALFPAEEPCAGTLGAIRAGLEMIDTVDRFKPYLQSLFGTSFRIGIGLHYGEIVVGMLGATDNRNVTAIGDAVNLASRIESANKEAGTELLISADAYANVEGHIHVGRRVRVGLKGKTGEYALYEVVGIDAPH